MSGGAVDDSHISQRKKDYYAKMSKLLNQYNKILVVTVDNVGSTHMQSIRKDIRGKAIMLMGKNTLMRKAMREFGQKVNNGIEPLIPLIYGNVGMVFVKDDLQEVKTLLVNNTVGAFAKVGANTTHATPTTAKHQQCHKRVKLPSSSERAQEVWRLHATLPQEQSLLTPSCSILLALPNNP